MSKKESTTPKIRKIVANKAARRNYEILEDLEAGIVLTGTEIKAIRAGKLNVDGAFAQIRNGEVFMRNVHIPQYANGSDANHEPLRTRKLLLKKKQLRHLRRKTEEAGLTLVPLELYFKDALVKVKLGLARGKKIHDKRQDVKERDTKRELDRIQKSYNQR